MPFVFARGGLAVALRCLVGQVPARGLVLRLFANDWHPGVDDEADALIEVRGGDYAPLHLGGEDWAVTSRDVVEARCEEQVFAFDRWRGAAFGYFLTRGTELVGGERFNDGPYRIARVGDEIRVTPRIELRQE